MTNVFFNIFEHSEFVDIPELEQKIKLIEHGVYVEGKSLYTRDFSEKNNFFYSSTNYPKYLGEDFLLNDTTYTLNPIFFDEFFNTILHYFDIDLINIKNYIDTLKFKIEFSGEYESIIENAKKNYTENLIYKSFQEFHLAKDEDEKIHIQILKKQISCDYFPLSRYLVGFNFDGDSYVYRNYRSFILDNMIINLHPNYDLSIEKKIEINSDFKLPKFIAMLNQIGFFNSEEIKNLTWEKKGKIVLALLQKDYNHINSIHHVVKNIQILNPNSTLDSKNFTSNKYVSDVDIIIKSIKFSK